jgi:hypothetical protein
VHYQCQILFHDFYRCDSIRTCLAPFRLKCSLETGPLWRWLGDLLAILSFEDLDMFWVPAQRNVTFQKGDFLGTILSSGRKCRTALRVVA